MSNVRIENEHLSVEIVPMGAEMQSLRTRDGADWLWNGDPQFWTGRAPVLFPMVGRAPEDHISVDGQRFAMSQHGFARRNEFTLIESGADYARFELRANETTHQVYPFEFSLVVEHRLEGRGVRTTAVVSNLDQRPMPYGIGFHPAFLWPLPGCTGEKHSVRLDNGGEPLLAQLADGLVKREKMASPFTKGELALHDDLFKADAMIFPEGAGTGLRYGADSKAIHFSWENLPNFALWSKPGAQFVCLEPWHGTAAMVGGSDALEERPFVEVLEPGGRRRYGFSVELEG
ncbi:aldose 1-epimerase family protein [Devosia submarina]|uniref:aldose 1-epimerase family protein n=1 Tax=Devosia submarina TaxID=1173082 RepID=UPI000D385641|nr:aldose 1-epimerase family protein [Devosia submarina]